MDIFHWASLAVGLVMVLGALVLSGVQKQLTAMHVIIAVTGAVLAGVPVVSMTLGPQPTIQIGAIKQAASDTNAATQAQAQAIATLNDRVTQLASLISKIPVSTAPPSGEASQVAPPPVASAMPAPAAVKPVLIAPELLPEWTRDVAAFRRSGAEITRLNDRSLQLTASSKTALAR